MDCGIISTDGSVTGNICTVPSLGAICETPGSIQFNLNLKGPLRSENNNP